MRVRYVDWKLYNFAKLSFNTLFFYFIQDNVSELFSKFKSLEVDLTVNHTNMHETVDNESVSSNDDTILFKSLASVAIEPPLQRIGSTLHLSDTRMMAGNRHGGVRYNQPQREWSVAPTRLQMNAYDPAACVRSLTIANNMSSTQSFEVVAEVDQLFEIRPSSGSLRSGERIQVSVRLLNRSIPSEDLFLSVYFENDKIDVLVDVNRNLGQR